MPKRQLWLLRHGATEWSINGRHTGTTDLPLLAEGEAEARRLAPVLSRHTFAAVMCSPLQRAQRTCELGGLGSQAQVETNLREWDYGNYEGMTTAEIQRAMPDRKIWTHGCPSGDDAAAVQQRCQHVIDQAMAVEEPGDVALFSHGHLLRALTGCWLGLGAQAGSLFKLSTGSICVLGHDHEQRAINCWNAPTTGTF